MTCENASFPLPEQEVQLMLTNPRDAFTGQSRSPNKVQFDTLGIVSYQFAIIVTLSLSIFEIFDFKMPRSLKIDMI